MVHKGFFAIFSVHWIMRHHHANKYCLIVLFIIKSFTSLMRTVLHLWVLLDFFMPTIEFQKVLYLYVLPLWLTNISEGDPGCMNLDILLGLLLYKYLEFLGEMPSNWFILWWVCYIPVSTLMYKMFYCHLSNGLFFSIAAVPLCRTLNLLKKLLLVKHVEQL